MKNGQLARAEAMGTDSIWRLLIRFGTPAIVSMLVASSYNVVDAIFVGRLGIDALAAITVSFPLMMIFMAIGIGTGTGAASAISRRLGAGEHEGASRVAGVTITTTLLLGALFTAIILPNLEGLFRLFKASDAVLPLAMDYMSILATWMVVAFFPMAIGTIIRAEGNPILPSVVMAASALLNIALDPLLIFGLGPFPEMGIAGAATATVIARTAGGLVIAGYFVTGRSAFRFRPSHFIPRLSILIEIYRIGAASIVRTAAMSMVIMVVNRTAAGFGDMPLAVLGVLFRGFSFVMMPAMGLGQAVLPLVGFNYGAGKLARAGEVVIKAAMASTVWGILAWVLVMAFPRQLVSIFSDDPAFVDLGASAVRIFALAFLFLGVHTPAGFFFQGIGKALPSLVLASSREILFLLPAALILPRIFGISGLWAAFPTADILSVATTITLTIYYFRKLGIPFRLRFPKTSTGDAPAAAPRSPSAPKSDS